MQVMVMNDDPAVQVRVAKGLRMQGFQVVGMETVARACDYVKVDPVDLLIMGERVAGRLSHSVALAAECANPLVTTIILTDRRDREVEELYDLLPSLYALVGPDNAPSVIASIALAAIANPEDAEARMRRNAVARELQQLADWDAAEEEAEYAPLTAVAEFASEDPLDASRDTATWGTEEAVLSLAAEPPEPDEQPVSAASFADIFGASGAAEEGCDTAAAIDLHLSAARAEIPARIHGPVRPRSLAPAVQAPEIVPQRLSRTDWIAAKVRELDHGEPARAGRLHLA